MGTQDLAVRIERALAQNMPGARLIRLEPMHGGISAVTNRCVVEQTDGALETLVIRQPNPKYCAGGRHAIADEFRVLSAIAKAGLPAPVPRFMEVYGDEIERPFMALDYIEGKPMLDASDPLEFARKFAYQLADIHDVGPDGFGFLPRQDTDVWPLSRPAIEDFREAEVRAAIANLKSVCRNQAVLRHGDFWPGNVLWKDGEISGVVDWEESLIGEPLSDLAIGRLDILWVYGHEASQVFTDEYLARRPIDVSDLAYFDLCAATRPMGNLDEWASSFPPLGRADVTEASMARNLLEFVDRALNALR